MYEGVRGGWMEFNQICVCKLSRKNIPGENDKCTIVWSGCGNVPGKHLCSGQYELNTENLVEAKLLISLELYHFSLAIDCLFSYLSIDSLHWSTKP